MLKRKEGGYLIVDHRNSPGLTEEQARLVGYDPRQCGEGKVFEAPSMRCKHCHGHVVKNPLRIRPRQHCWKCDHYICDLCAFEASQPGYVHRAFDEKIEKIIKG